ncbi:hypothetical protein A3C21_02875 [Candidatus Kaiserbacteria bacterium RIFCSPHIGHO2_02_FULL_59_21]|uniref:Fido domain-containing protein n=1 Tax=Candidatus Kaiserbacteria bacterium RIFCSPHIGHO2_02_FULL_59_21 TaxID=1798500 RepID=A0A1F6DZ45_9BACT|nr:MAG: hypothetical protein A3C21_02875 [Candidatus Kaiserbacteria bacterium RIFCSPHIGHO2_02_FULL_59_21]OGG79018.1 MAG: hypothetical protein A2952_01480 [Candidatus Kaiserbacteria bacterium RIFCSPLOWO2_01_FULL_59_34]OGG84358.1 MAG: hypothetical protein A3I47_01725 [Candidatus Kaiserbacteria bacterium RIFCSPLOWO2_02_FULL_59_19]
MRYLTAEEILVLHALIIDETGGSHGVRDTHLLASIAHKPRFQFGGRELYPGIFLKAAVLLESIANYHIFVDGNKRTALVATSRFLHLNGYDLLASDQAAEQMVLSVATKDMDIKKVASWLKKNSKRIGKKRK